MLVTTKVENVNVQIKFDSEAYNSFISSMEDYTKDLDSEEYIIHYVDKRNVYLIDYKISERFLSTANIYDCFSDSDLEKLKEKTVYSIKNLSMYVEADNEFYHVKYVLKGDFKELWSIGSHGK